MGIFKNKKQTVSKDQLDELIPSGKFNAENKTILSSVLNTILEIGDESDYEYLCSATAKTFFDANKEYLVSIVEHSGDDFHVTVQFLNYFLSMFNLGSLQINVDMDDKKITVFHYDSIFNYIHEKNYFMKEFYRLFFNYLLNTEVEISERNEDEKTIFVISI